MERRRIGEGGPAVTRLCIGTSPLGGMPAAYGYDVDRERAVATVEAALDSEIAFLDTSNEYGDGEAERRVCSALDARGGVPDGFVIATKADPERGGSSFAAGRVRGSFAESAARLGMERFEVFHLHDPDRFPFSDMSAPGGAVEGMRALRDEGLVSKIGVAGGDIEQMRRYVDLGVFDILLTHSQYNLLDRSANDLIDHAVDAGLACLNAAPYASGMLAKPIGAGANFQYRPPTPAVIEATTWLHRACARYGVPLAALALQFSTRDPRVTSTVVGVTSPARIGELVDNDRLDIPGELWAEVEARLGLVRPANA